VKVIKWMNHTKNTSQNMSHNCLLRIIMNKNNNLSNWPKLGGRSSQRKFHSRIIENKSKPNNQREDIKDQYLQKVQEMITIARWGVRKITMHNISVNQATWRQKIYLHFSKCLIMLTNLTLTSLFTRKAKIAMSQNSSYTSQRCFCKTTTQ